MFTFALVTLSELFFRAEDFGQSKRMLRDLVINPVLTEQTLATLWIAVKTYAVLLLIDFCEYRTNDHEAVLRWPVWIRRPLMIVMLFQILRALGNDATSLGEAFEYFKF